MRLAPRETIGDGVQDVYVYSFPSLIHGDRWPCKIGKARSGYESRIANQQASMIEAPIVLLLIKTDNCSLLERQIHFRLIDRRLDAFGNEWFMTNTDEVKSAVASTKISDQNIWEQLRTARYEMGLTQAGLAHEAGIRQATVSSIENGRASSMPAILRLCDAMGKKLVIVDKSAA